MLQLLANRRCRSRSRAWRAAVNSALAMRQRREDSGVSYRTPLQPQQLQAEPRDVLLTPWRSAGEMVMNKLLLLAALGLEAAYSSEGPTGNTWTDKHCWDIPLCDAARDGKLPEVKQLLEKGVNVDEQDTGGDTALSWCRRRPQANREGRRPPSCPSCWASRCRRCCRWCWATHRWNEAPRPPT